MELSRHRKPDVVALFPAMIRVARDTPAIPWAQAAINHGELDRLAPMPDRSMRMPDLLGSPLVGSCG